VFALYLAEEKIEPEVVENMRTRPHSGFSVNQSVFLPASDRAGIERLVGYMTRCPFSLSRLVKVTETGQVIYKAEKDACRAFPDPQGDELACDATVFWEVPTNDRFRGAGLARLHRTGGGSWSAAPWPNGQPAHRKPWRE
jgi:hypothetical protein